MAIPLTRLGGQAFNHRTSVDIEAEYDRLRDLAREEADKRNDCFARSREAYSSGDGAGAKSLSNAGKSHAAKMDDYNRQASDFIFRENNAPGRVEDDCIDLHGQFVDEAERILEERIRADSARGASHLHVIVGKGNHSSGHVQKIKPRVEELCREMGLRCTTEENEGRIYVDLGGKGGQGQGPYHGGQGQHHGGQGQQHGGQGQYHGGQGQQHGGQGQYHGGQSQQHGGQKQDDDDGLLGAVLKCCVVM